MNSYYKGNAKVVSLLSVLRHWVDRGALYKLRNSGEGAGWREIWVLVLKAVAPFRAPK